MLSETAIKDFKKLYKAEFGDEPSDDEALELGINLLTIFNHIYKPIQASWVGEYDNGTYRKDIKKCGAETE